MCMTSILLYVKLYSECYNVLIINLKQHTRAENTEINKDEMTFLNYSSLMKIKWHFILPTHSAYKLCTRNHLAFCSIEKSVHRTGRHVIRIVSYMPMFGGFQQAL